MGQGSRTQCGGNGASGHEIIDVPVISQCLCVLCLVAIDC
jgi:hypothetical protein